MEIIIAMALSFLLGAYIRAPFRLFNKSKENEEEAVGAKDEEQLELEKQLNNLLNYGREER